MTNLNINGNSPEPIQNSKTLETSNSNKTVTKWSNSIYTLAESGDNKVGWNDLKNEINRGKNISEAAREIFRQIDKFFTENDGKTWNNTLVSQLNQLLQNFNSKNKIDDRKTEEYFNDANQMTGYTHYDENGQVASTGEFTYHPNGDPNLFTSRDANGKITYQARYEKRPDGQFEEVNITKYDWE